MVRENFCMLQKSVPLILQPRKPPLWSHYVRNDLNLLIFDGLVEILTGFDQKIIFLNLKITQIGADKVYCICYVFALMESKLGQIYT